MTITLLKKRFVVLLELMIAMGLAMAVLSFSLYFYRYSVLMDVELKKEEAVAFRDKVLSGRLNQVFAKIEQTPFFTLSDQSGISRGSSLIFSFFSESRAPTFHGQALGRLLVDQQGRLLLAIWQYNKLLGDNLSPPMQLEILAEKVEGITFEFLVGEIKKDQTELKPGSYVSEWKKEYDKLPAAIKMKILGEREQEFAFPLPEMCGEEE